MGLPFGDQGEAAVCARVALALIRRARKQARYRDLQPPILIGVTTEGLKGLHLGTVRSALLSVNHWTLSGGTTDTWLKHVLYCDAMRFTIRRAYFADYKGNRR